MTYFAIVPILNADFALSFARSWIDGWNQHDIDAVLSHYADDFELASPLIPSIAGEPSCTGMFRDRIVSFNDQAITQLNHVWFHVTY